MKNELTKWTKAELKIYILLLCAKIDQEESEEEMALIKSKTDLEIFDKLYNEFCCDEEDSCFEKIEDAINHHHYTPKELKLFTLFSGKIGTCVDAVEQIMENI